MTQLMILSDYDGTLTSIAPTPQRATLSRRTRAILHRLSRTPGIRLGVISGRSLRDVKRFVGLPALLYAGNHGLELEGPGFSFVHPRAQAARADLYRLAKRLRGVLRRVPGAWVEWKGLTFSLHWRAVRPSDQPLFYALATRELQPLRQRGRIRVTHGKRVVEVRPAVDWGKGEAVQWFWHHLPTPRATPRPWVIYLGDDHTDEGAFHMTNRLGGISVLVGTPGHRTAATYGLRSPRLVPRWLTALSQRWREQRRHDRRDLDGMDRSHS